ncbi:malectin domain-containing carbohydrate-binding protein [Streptomyces sp. NPDC002033]|uniref:malectin domain-containing carbohydrate-binding protein n=1 Tax=unclassified Streptomyces TaxID=2593676 RepID=UPI003327174D
MSPGWRARPGRASRRPARRGPGGADVVVPRYQAALDAGSDRAATDVAGDTWSPDRKYSPGSYGYRGASTVRSTGRAIAATQDQKLFRNAREGMDGYRFDNVPNGTYTVELGFAELSSTRPGRRVLDSWPRARWSCPPWTSPWRRAATRP